jgi:hypothetical protein
MNEIIEKIGIGFDNRICLKNKKSTIYLYWTDNKKELLNIIDKKEDFWILDKEVESYLNFQYKNFKIKE